MILQQHYLGCLAQASYLIACEATKRAVVVDPRRDVSCYLEQARDLGLTIEHVVLTHFHADFLAGHLELREATGATIHLGARAKAEFAFAPLGHGERIELGKVRIEARETPGHTPEAICLLVFDLERSADVPQAVLTGDTLFVGDVGRPDLMASVGVTAEELASQLYDSLHQQLLTLPDETLVYPGHGAGSMCGKALGSETVTTIGAQRRTNYALQPMSRERFVSLVAGGLSRPPRYFAWDAQLNRREHPTLEASLAASLRPLPLDEVLRLQGQGAQVLDAHDPVAFAERHLLGSVNVGLGGKYAQWAGAVLDPERPIVLVAPAGKEQEAALRLGRIGFDHVAGFLEGGHGALEGRPDLVGRLVTETPATLRDELSGEAPPLLLDVRGLGEREAARIEGEDRHVCLTELVERLAEVPPDRPVVVYCASGYRSSIAASLLARQGIDARNLAGGIVAWQELQAAAAS